VDQFSTRQEMLITLMIGARGGKFASYPEGVFGIPRDMHIGC
jgi:hypothetical protein